MVYRKAITDITLAAVELYITSIPLNARTRLGELCKIC